MITKQQAAKLIKIARETISARLSNKGISLSPEIKKEFSEPSGIFVTINKNGSLRGCIGYIENPPPLHEGIVNAALNAAFSDPRFPALGKDELKECNIEISILSRPRIIEVKKPEDYIKNIKIGKDGLLIRGVFSSGLLLPQVATEYSWDPKTFLEQTCIKAGLNPDSWNDFERCTVLKFQGQVFAEGDGGEITQRL